MRPVLLLTALLALGCALGSPRSEVCEAWLDCLAEADADAFTAASPVYGRGGSCWDGDRDACETACATGQRAAAYEHQTLATCATPVDGSFVVASGIYVLTPVGAPETDCEGEVWQMEVVADVDVEDDGSAFTLALAVSTPVLLDCTLDGNEFDCDPWIQEGALDGGVYTIEVIAGGEWTSALTFEANLSYDQTCEGSGCADYADYWCSASRDFEAVRD